MNEISARRALEDNIKPADLQLRLYQLLESEEILTTGTLVTNVRAALETIPNSEEVMLIANDIFVGLIREAAACPPDMFKVMALKNLLRQAVVASCTALDAFLPALLRDHLPTVIQVRGRDFYPQEKEMQGFFAELKFDLPEILRLIGDSNSSLYITNKILKFINFKYLSSRRGVSVTGMLLAIREPWEQIAGKLARTSSETAKVLDELAIRRNDIVHRADRPQTDPAAEIQDITYAYARNAVETVCAVCIALDDLVNEKMLSFKVDQETLG